MEFTCLGQNSLVKSEVVSKTGMLEQFSDGVTQSAGIYKGNIYSLDTFFALCIYIYTCKKKNT